MRALLLAGMVAIGWAGSAEASAIVTFQQVGAGVVVDFAGTLNLTNETVSATPFSSGNAASAGPSIDVISIGARSAPQTEYLTFSGPANYGSSGEIFADTTAGDAIYFNSSTLYLPVSYVSGNGLSATEVFNNRSLASFGLSPTASVFSLPSGDTITITHQVSAVPEPASLALLGLGVAGIAAVRRRRVG